MARDDGIDPRSVVVLPFLNVSSDPEQEYFSDGLTLELIGVLGGWRGVSVSATRRKKEASPAAVDRFEEDQETTDWITSIAPDLLKDDD